MLNTMVPDQTPDTASFYADPIRRYMIPVATDRHLDWPSHPHATRDSLHEHDMWVAEGLTHRYPTKVLAELLSTCPQYCGHCTRMDLVGNSTPTVDKLKLTLKPVDRYDAHLAYLKAHPGVRDVVVSGGDVANVPWKQLEAYLMGLLSVPDRPRHPARHQGPRWACPSTGCRTTSSKACTGSPSPPNGAASTSPSTPTSTTSTR